MFGAGNTGGCFRPVAPGNREDKDHENSKSRDHQGGQRNASRPVLFKPHPVAPAPSAFG